MLQWITNLRLLIAEIYGESRTFKKTQNHSYSALLLVQLAVFYSQLLQTFSARWGKTKDILISGCIHVTVYKG